MNLENRTGYELAIHADHLNRDLLEAETFAQRYMDTGSVAATITRAEGLAEYVDKVRSRLADDLSAELSIEALSDVRSRFERLRKELLDLIDGTIRLIKEDYIAPRREILTGGDKLEEERRVELEREVVVHENELVELRELRAGHDVA